MSQETPQDHVSKKRVLYEIPGMDAVRIRRDVEYAGGLTMDLYYPADTASEARTPAVVFVSGYPDAGFQRIVGCRFKEMGAYVSWSQLAAVSGWVAITYTNLEPADVHSLLQYVRQNAAALGIDENRIGLWACSGNAPMALSVLMQERGEFLKCAVLCYPLLLDFEGSSVVARASQAFRFANPCAGKSVHDLPQQLPLFLARAGRDENPGLNDTLDRFVSDALIRNLPITVVNHPEAPHAFDLMHDSETTRDIIRHILAFLQFHLLAGSNE